MNGSVVPKGADCVVKFEGTDEPKTKADRLRQSNSRKVYVAGRRVGFPSPRQHIKGDLLSRKILLLVQASFLHYLPSVKNRQGFSPYTNAIITSGDVLQGGMPLVPGKVYNSNEAAMRSFVAHYGGYWVIGVASDNEKSLFTKIQKGLSADAIITTGGVSKGDYDLLRRVIEKMGKLYISSIKLGPAMAFGMLKSAEGKKHTTIPIFALEGPPQGCMIDFEILVRPAMLKMRGIQELIHPVVEAISEVDNLPPPCKVPRFDCSKENRHWVCGFSRDATVWHRKQPLFFDHDSGKPL
jgi:molybdopterin molybdotransferase